MAKKSKILIVDDRPENLYTLDMLLKGLNVEVWQALSGTEALSLTLQHDFCVAIVDIQMPEMDGYELVELLRSNKTTVMLPVIFVSAIYSDEYHHRKGYEAGAVDFLSKPFVPEILLSKVKIFIDLYQQRQVLQEEIKQRQQAEAALQETNRVLAKLNVDKDKFFSTISHDLRSPLNTSLNNSHQMIHKIDKLTLGQLQHLAEQTYTSTLTISNLVETLMTWSNLQRVHLKQPFTEINLRDLAYQAVEVWRDMAALKNVDLINDIQEDIYVYADEMMLPTIISNLLANALKYTLNGDQVTLSTHPVHPSELDQQRTSPGLIAISVVDTGIGISPEDLTRLFRIDTSPTTPGTAQETGAGLGLIMCKEMVEYQGGRIWVDSKPGQGTIVTFTVPLMAEFARYL
jgi:signal transduction histidine kinase